MAVLLTLPCIFVLFTLIVFAALCESLTKLLELEDYKYTSQYKYYKGMMQVCMGFLTAGFVVDMVILIT